MQDTAAASGGSSSQQQQQHQNAAAATGTAGCQNVLTGTVESDHGDMVHDTQFDYYGRYIATCSSDKTIRIFRAGDGAGVAELVGHSAPVWMVAWAPPEFGTALASCSYDGKVIIWKEGGQQDGGWKPSHIMASHTGSVNAISWASASRSGAQGQQGGCGAALASAGSDGRILVTSFIGGVWQEPVNCAPHGSNVAHSTGALAVSFAADSPAVNPEEGPACTFLASAGCDGIVRVFCFPGSPASDAVQQHDAQAMNSNNNTASSAAGGSSSSSAPSWAALCTIQGSHKEWVRDVAFSPDSSSRWLTLASCGEDKTVVIRRTLREKAEAAANAAASKRGGVPPLEWETSKAIVLPSAVWRLSWSPDGSQLLATTGDSQAFLLKQGASFAEAWTKAPVSEN